ncbi:hypothetical protein NMY22_g12840 [Coprinellus aureogranulatus]|nr:hypothetical protein NMY22_g12840 [Coprinellus aureogranulatus]
MEHVRWPNPSPLGPTSTTMESKFLTPTPAEEDIGARVGLANDARPPPPPSTASSTSHHDTEEGIDAGLNQREDLENHNHTRPPTPESLAPSSTPSADEGIAHIDRHFRQFPNVIAMLVPQGALEQLRERIAPHPAHMEVLDAPEGQGLVLIAERVEDWNAIAGAMTITVLPRRRLLALATAISTGDQLVALIVGFILSAAIGALFHWCLVACEPYSYILKALHVGQRITNFVGVILNYGLFYPISLAISVFIFPFSCMIDLYILLRRFGAAVERLYAAARRVIHSQLQALLTVVLELLEQLRDGGSALKLLSNLLRPLESASVKGKARCEEGYPGLASLRPRSVFVVVCKSSPVLSLDLQSSDTIDILTSVCMGCTAGEVGRLHQQRQIQNTEVPYLRRKAVGDTTLTRMITPQLEAVLELLPSRIITENVAKRCRAGVAVTMRSRDDVKFIAPSMAASTRRVHSSGNIAALQTASYRDPLWLSGPA